MGHTYDYLYEFILKSKENRLVQIVSNERCYKWVTEGLLSQWVFIHSLQNSSYILGSHVKSQLANKQTKKSFKTKKTRKQLF